MTVPILIQELTGSQREVSLGGRALPERPLPAGGLLRHKKTWYPGSGVATLQVLGSEVSSTQFQGVWNDRFIGGQVTTTGFETPELARELVTIFEQLRDSGNTLRFEWGPVVRRGILAQFEPLWLRQQDVRWTMLFEWEARDDQEVPRATLDEPPNSAELRTRLNESDDNLAFKPKAVKPSYATTVIEQINSVRGRVTDIFDRIRVAQSFQSVPLSSVRGALAAAEGLRLEGNALSVDLVEDPIEVATTFETLLDRVRVDAWRREQGRRVRRLQARGQSDARDLRKLSNPQPIAVVTMRGGNDSLRRVARRFYGTADEWRRIAQANDLPDSTVAAGTLIVVPPLSAPIDTEAC